MTTVRKIAILAVATAFVFGACRKRPKDVLAENDMVDLLVDLQLADAYYSTTSSSPDRVDRKILVESVLEKHGVSREQLDSTISYYGRNMDEYSALYDKVETRLRRESGKNQTEEEKDDIWPYSRFAAIFPNMVSDGISFSFPAEDVAPGSALEWYMRLSAAEGAEAMLGVEYENGNSTFVRKNPSNQRNMQLTLQTDTGQPVKRVFGVMTVPTKNMPVWADSIRLTRADYDSLAYYKIRQQKIVRPPQPKPAPSAETDSVEASMD